MNDNVRKPGCVISLGGLNLFTLAFVILKLCHVIDWSWCWVLAPTWIPITLSFILFIVWIILIACVDNHHY